MPSFRGCPPPHRGHREREAFPGAPRWRGGGFGVVQHEISLTNAPNRSINPREGKTTPFAEERRYYTKDGVALSSAHRWPSVVPSGLGRSKHRTRASNTRAHSRLDHAFARAINLASIPSQRRRREKKDAEEGELPPGKQGPRIKRARRVSRTSTPGAGADSAELVHHQTWHHCCL